MSEIRPFPPGSKGVDTSGDAVLKRLMMVGELNERVWFSGSSDLPTKAAKHAGSIWRTRWLPAASEYRDRQPMG